MKYSQLTIEKRSQICALKSKKVSQKEIARIVKVSSSTIGRELRRNANSNFVYVYPEANKIAENRRSKASKRPKRLTEELKNEIEKKLLEGWSPEQISGRFKKEGKPISYETIYQYISADRANGGILYLHLRRRGKKYRPYGYKLAGKSCIPNRIGIEKRPAEVETKLEIGHLEGDTIIGKEGKGAILTLVERKSKFVLIERMDGKFAAQVPRLVRASISRLPMKIPMKTVTFDNGSEFSEHVEITNQTGINCYFARPYHSWERALNEHTNGLIRQYIPKKSNFDDLFREDLQVVENLLNNRPRKVLGYRTPLEVFLYEACRK